VLQPLNNEPLLKDVPPEKIEANALSSSVAKLLKEGMSKAPLVEMFFDKWHDPFFGERVATAFRQKYMQCREQMTPNQIFEEFQSWVGGSERGNPLHELAIITIVAYYFERCDIFEEPKAKIL
jgi:hypothetical protein